MNLCAIASAYFGILNVHINGPELLIGLDLSTVKRLARCRPDMRIRGNYPRRYRLQEEV